MKYTDENVRKAAGLCWEAMKDSQGWCQQVKMSPFNIIIVLQQVARSCSIFEVT